MTSPLALYEEGLRAGAPGVCARARLRDGTVLAVPLDRYLGPPDATDRRLLVNVDGPVLDVGCGPGRHLRALSARGVFAVGVDLSPVAVALAVGDGCRAIVADVFGELPGARAWRTALLLDGNIGIGGAPERLLSRIAALLAHRGELIVELDAPGTATGATMARLERDDRRSGWFPWARVSVSSIVPLAAATGFDVIEITPIAARWFARLVLIGSPRTRSPASANGAAGPVP